MDTLEPKPQLDKSGGWIVARDGAIRKTAVTGGRIQDPTFRGKTEHFVWFGEEDRRDRLAAVRKGLIP